MLTTLDLFSGIGGFALAGRMIGGFDVRQFVEIDPYCRGVLAKNFPGVPIHDDIRTYSAQPGDFACITAGFPCQDISTANPNGRGLDGERSGLFYEVLRIIRECRPEYVVLENVSALLSKRSGRDMGAILWSLSESGYDAEWQTISAASVGAPHLRERVFVVAYCHSQRRDGGRNNWRERHLCSNIDGDTPKALAKRIQLLSEFGAVGETDANTNGRRHDGGRAGKTGVAGSDRPETKIGTRGSIETEGFSQTLSHSYRAGRKKLNIAAVSSEQGHDSRGTTPAGNPWATEPGILRVADGISNRVDRIRALGNSVVPQCAAISLQRVLQLGKDRQSKYQDQHCFKRIC